MSAYLSRSTTPDPLATRSSTIDSLTTNPVLAAIRESGAADIYVASPAVGRAVTTSLDRTGNFFGMGIVFRSSSGRMRQVRLPAKPGDLTLFVLFGPPPSATPHTPPPGAADQLRHEVRVGGLGCAAAVIGWIGLVAGAFVSGPVGWVAISLVAFDATASGAASISCLESGVRVLNERRNRHDLNERMDANRAYAVSSRVQDGIGLAAVPRAAFTTVGSMVRAGSFAAATGASGAIATGGRIIREIVLSPEVRVEILNAVGAGIGFAGSAAGGLAAEGAGALPPFPTFTVAMAN